MRGWPVATFEQQAVSTLDGLRTHFFTYQSANSLKQRYYDGKFRIKDLGISLPPSMASIDSVVGWPGTAVDVMDERLDFEGWSDDSLDPLFRLNDLDVKAPTAHLDALIYGTAFVTVTSGDVGEPDVVISVASATDMVVSRDHRTGLVSEAAQFIPGDRLAGVPERAVLFRPWDTTWLVNDHLGWVVEKVDQHNLGRVPVAQLVNRPRASKLGGRSDITPAVRSYTDSALRTLVGAEVAREFYAVPQRYMMGAPEQFFLDENGNPRGAWDAMMGKILAVGEDPETGSKPDVGSFAAHSMSPFFEQVRHYSQLLAAETSIPPTYLGFTTDNPSSADAIRMAENRLVKRAERRQTWFGKAWTEVARLALMVQDGRSFDQLSDDELSIRPLWRDAATPTKAATTDQATKLALLGVPFGDYMMKLLGLSPTEKEMLERDMANSTRALLLQSLQQRSSLTTEDDRALARQLASRRVDGQPEGGA